MGRFLPLTMPVQQVIDRQYSSRTVSEDLGFRIESLKIQNEIIPVEYVCDDLNLDRKTKFSHNFCNTIFCIKPYVPTEPRRDPSNCWVNCCLDLYEEK